MNQDSSQKPREDFLLEEFLPYRLSLLSNTVSQGIAIAYRGEYGLSVTEWRVIAVLGRFPGLTATEVLNRTAMDKVAVSRAVKKLQERFLVERSPHSEDRRRLPLKLTAKGKKLHADIVPKAIAYESGLLSALSATDQKALNRLITRLQGAADDLNDPRD